MTRKEAIAILNHNVSACLHGTEWGEALDMAIEALKQEQNTGHWYIDERPEGNGKTICSNCEQPIFKYHKLDFDYRPKYCPNCGIKMEVEE